MKQSRILFICLLLVAVVTSAGWAGYRAKVRSTLQPGSKLSFSGTSTMHDWSCEAKAVTGYVEHEPSGKLKLGSVEVTVPIDNIDCGHAAMNSRLKLTLKGKEFPQIQYKLTGIKEAAKGSNIELQTKGTLTVAGVAKTVVMVVTANRAADGSVHFQGSLPMKMTTFGIEPPAFLGITTGDDIKVNFDVVAAAKPQS